MHTLNMQNNRTRMILKSPIEGSDEHIVKRWRWVWIEADFESFVVMGIDAKTRNETINH